MFLDQFDAKCRGAGGNPVVVKNKVVIYKQQNIKGLAGWR